MFGPSNAFLTLLLSSLSLSVDATACQCVESYGKMSHCTEVLGWQREMSNGEHGPRVAGAVGQKIEECSREIEQLQSCCLQGI